MALLLTWKTWTFLVIFCQLSSFCFYFQGQMASRISRVRPNSSSPVGEINDVIDEENEDVPYAETAICKPELTTIPLNQSSDPNIFILPNCVRIERCGGCCHHDLLECQPTHMERKRMKVIQMTYQSSRYVWKSLRKYYHFFRYESFNLETFGDTFLPLKNAFRFLVTLLHFEYSELPRIWKNL